MLKYSKIKANKNVQNRIGFDRKEPTPNVKE